ncbi:hypothetical protein K4F52_005947 [Lecanicillium sp. MT-2017a]|nr:hypothetical protein K4F52_005947 [Lecanicillium sp. MT-2017a]
MAQHSVQELVSPPSSPDTATWKKGPGEDNVSPIDSDVSLEEFVSKVNGPRREAPLADLSKRTNIPVKRREQALPQLPGESSLDERASSPAPALDTRRTLPSQQQQVPEPELKRAPGGDISRRQRVVSNQHKRNSIGPTQLLAADTAVGPYPYQNENVPPQSLGQRFRQAASRSKAHSIENRPPWHGASGRESVVKPMHDDVNVAPLNVPSRLKRASGRGEGSLRNRLSHIGQSRDGSSPSTAMRKLLSSKAHKKASSMAISAPIDRYDWNSNTTGAESYPSPPSEPPGQTSIQPLQLPPSPTPLHMPQLNQIKRKPPPPPSTAHIDQRSSHAHPLASSPVNPDELPIRGSPEAQPLPSPPAEKADDWDQPPSRFSITTYATTAVEGTPRTDTGSGEPSPLLPTVDPSTPVMQRGRPLPRADNLSSTSNSPASASPVQSPRGEFPPIEASRVFHSPRPSSSISTSKPLPPAPPEVSASDRVAHLTAQLNGLANRRININRCVKQMTELMPTDSVMAGEQVRQRREEEKKKVEALRTELAEVQREEYELGLMLHRAYKRQDREAQYEPTTLWVRRVAA